jgi:hypothetical protein
VLDRATPWRAAYKWNSWHHKPEQKGQQQDDTKGNGELTHLILPKYFLCDGLLGPKTLDVHSTTCSQVLKV